MFGYNTPETRVTLGEHLTLVSTAVSGLLASVDPHFLVLGEKLNETYSASQQLSGLVLKTLNLDDAGKNKNRLKDIHALSGTVVQTLRCKLARRYPKYPV